MHIRPFGRRTAGRQRESREADAPWPQGWLPERHIATLATFLLTARKLPLEVFKLVLDIGPFAVRRGGNPPAPSRGGRASEVTGCNACKCSSVGHHLSIPLLRTRSTPSWRSPQVSLARLLESRPRAAASGTISCSTRPLLLALRSGLRDRMRAAMLPPLHDNAQEPNAGIYEPQQKHWTEN